MVKILHEYLKKINQLITYVFSAEKKKSSIFGNGSKVKKISREGSSNLATESKRHFWLFSNKHI
jgi:hypothetical protein